MQIPDAINGLYELLGGFMVLNHCRALHRDKIVRGVSVLSTAFFMSWGFWNIVYYPMLHQWVSFYGGILLVTANAIWVSLALYYTHRSENRA